MTTRPTIIHIHIPKSAGTTINMLLGRAVRGNHFVYSRPGQPEVLAAMPQAERDRLDLVFGHVPYGLHRLFTRPVRYVASVREPRERILSVYYYLLATERHPKHLLVKENAPDFAAFLRLAARKPGIRDEVDNLQVRMLAGRMPLKADYGDVLPAAFANITAGNFLIADMRRMADLIAWLGRTMQLRFGPVPRLNASAKAVSFEEEMARLDPGCRDILEHYSRWDAMLCAFVADIAPGEAPGTPLPAAIPPGSVSTPALPPVPTGAAAARPATGPAAAGDDPLVREFVVALYRLLLLREPDAVGLAARLAQIRKGRPLENVMRQILHSPEFATKHRRFLETYVDPAGGPAGDPAGDAAAAGSPAAGPAAGP